MVRFRNRSSGSSTKRAIQHMLIKQVSHRASGCGTKLTEDSTVVVDINKILDVMLLKGGREELRK
jgi:hypothetical protein